MKFFLFSVFTFLTICIQAQSNFQRKLFQTAITGSVSEVVYSNEYNTTTFVIENLVGPTAYTGYSSLTKFTTTTGNVTSSKSFSIAGYDLAIKNVVKNNQMLYIVASLTNSTAVTGCIIKYNLSTNATVWRRTVAINQNPYTLNSISFDNNKYLYALGGCTNIKNNLFVIKLDTNGTFIWNKTIGDGFYDQIPAGIVYNGKRELYVTSTSTLNTVSNAVTLRLDSSGTILNSISLFTSSINTFREKYSTILKGKFVTLDKIVNISNGNSSAFMLSLLDSNLVSVATKSLDGLNVKQVFSNNVNLLITGAAPINLGLSGFRTIRLDTLLNVFGSRHFNKINTLTNNTSASCYINSTNNSFHFFRPNGNDTIASIRADIYEGVGCKDSAYIPGNPAITFSPSAYSYTVVPITGTLTTITLPIGTLTYTSISLCSALTTDIKSFSNNDFISIYPNPAKEMLNFKSDMSNSNLQIKISNSIGQLVKEEDVRIESNSGSVSTNDLSSGIYFLSLFDANNQLLVVKKFVKE